MKLTFLTLGSIASNPGHLARFVSVLKELSELHEINIICLSKNPDDEVTKQKYNKVSFHNFPIKTNGWHLVDIHETIKNLTDLIKSLSPELVVLQIEAWELMRELKKSLQGITKFTTLIHAMPFLTSPIQPSGNFENDVHNYISSGIEEFRKDYIKQHYNEAYEVLPQLPIIACNRTVSFYLQKYFDNLKIWNIEPLIKTSKQKTCIDTSTFKFDFVYMARMEAGKGIEYIAEILNRVAVKLQRQVTIAIIGRTDDLVSKTALESLLNNQVNYKAEYLGWLNENGKGEILPQSQVFLYPSHYDNYPTVLNEALAFGLPVVTWDVYSTNLNYLNVQAVRRIPLYDFEQFSYEIVNILNDRDTYSQQSLEFINTRVTALEAAQLDSRIYKEIISL